MLNSPAPVPSPRGIDKLPSRRQFNARIPAPTTSFHVTPTACAPSALTYLTLFCDQMWQVPNEPIPVLVGDHQRLCRMHWRLIDWRESSSDFFFCGWLRAIHGSSNAVAITASIPGDPTLILDGLNEEQSYLVNLMEEVEAPVLCNFLSHLKNPMFHGGNMFLGTIGVVLTGHPEGCHSYDARNFPPSNDREMFDLNLLRFLWSRARSDTPTLCEDAPQNHLRNGQGLMELGPQSASFSVVKGSFGYPHTP
ncbi:uncharacterized protein LACBIDRAFT_327426 [Laccaria bicolor S238N-H82]|uniref:Predicted protein n=1 Tax=Laccaria bicolor (strain S238N-H82 / ATCC MYA-4686) TaxID=486041 RepID=B0DB17_LACBS|nr:uncharacterized protein LACBIDRAFT_327426 [Laccaria bicolor S238N-H82]EDR08125.1 predicted protein [Laccaria bicolor S238N-H82]|eukprot:XP_001881195.1 predicted protein [Laccaria bicolor S238N-H82]